MLRIEQIDVYYNDLQALWGVSLAVRDGELVALVGSNGAGKSTLLKAISGLLRSKKGSISFRGTRIDKQEAHKIVELGICMVPEGRRLFADMSVFENLEIGAYLGKARQAKNDTINWLYRIFPVLEARAGQSARTLSGGEQQMLAIARALMSQPKILLLDEITLGLSPLLVDALFDVIKQINESSQIAILLVEQNVVVALELADTGYIMENGRIVGQGDAKVLLESKQIKDAYLGITAVSGEPK